MTPTLDAPAGDDRDLWAAVRARLTVDHAWLTAGVFRAVPVAVTSGADADLPAAPRTTPTGAVLGVDRWGRVYLDFSAARAAGVAAVAAEVQAAVLDWLSSRTQHADWFASRLDDRFAAVAGAQADRAARLVAAGVLATPKKPYGTDTLEQWREWATKIAGPPQVSWQEKLGASVRSAISARTGHHARTYSRLSRRQQPGVITPALRGPAARVAVIADISGSIADELATLVAEVSRIAASVSQSGGSGLLYAVDDEVASVTPLSGTTADLAPRPGHRTDLRAGFVAATAAHERADVIVVLTDGFTDWPETRIDAIVIVVLVGPSTVTTQTAGRVPTWAQTLQIAT